MGLLEKYGRKKTGEKRNKQIGAKIEPSLFEDFTKHCDNLGMSVSDGIRYLIMEELTKDITEKAKSETAVTLIDRNVITSIKTNDAPTSNKGNTKVKPKGEPSVLDRWTIDKQIPCPVCDKWMTRKSFKRHCKNIHGTPDHEEFIQAHSDKADQMVKEKQGETHESP